MNFGAMAHNARPSIPQRPIARSALKVDYLGEFNVIFKTALNHKSGDQRGAFVKITLDKKLLLLSLSGMIMHLLQCSGRIMHLL